MKDDIRVRFAPSPTGFLHIGSVRTALFNYLFAKKNNGKFILRIEDTDKQRSKKEFELDILQGMKWLGLNWDEGPDKEGDCGPYRQSDRNTNYKEYINRLLENGNAYYCFCSKEELETKKDYQIEKGIPPKYDGKCSNISLEDAKKRIANGEKAVIRFRVPCSRLAFDDLIRGKVEFDCSLFGDFVIATDESTPLYNMACVVDDHEMDITHIIRGEDHIPNTPKQILIGEALGFKKFVYAHLPMILGPDKSKLSKRHNAEPINYYYQNGYLPDAINNFIAFLGWNPGDEREMFTLKELEQEFSIERCRPSGSIFNVQKLNWFNTQYIKKTDTITLVKLIAPILESRGLIIREGEEITLKTGKKVTGEYIANSITPYKERLTTLTEFADIADFFYQNISYDKELLLWKDMTEEDVKKALELTLSLFEKIDDWKQENLEKTILDYLEQNKETYTKRGFVLWPIRAALTGKKASCSPFEAAHGLGKEESILRINNAIKLWN